MKLRKDKGKEKKDEGSRVEAPFRQLRKLLEEWKKELKE